MQPVGRVAFEEEEQPAELDPARGGVGGMQHHVLRNLHQLPPKSGRLDRSREGLGLAAFKRQQPVRHAHLPRAGAAGRAHGVRGYALLHHHHHRRPGHGQRVVALGHRKHKLLKDGAVLLWTGVQELLQIAKCDVLDQG
jgi:hypothetical protein